ncbi:hypothetical protein E0H47_27555 [Rhizobium leguminosarum bv. viciae]|uniref:hypothetical protein n=1 Tax=Rhizobium leguminosarum TaxID=384 RepID=UPI0010375A6C|nr:hypothetical protein [Rhizobium leguminosarum]TBG89368.1 hypothetical protein ELG67_09835 [Rhizobium leguminosarum]TBZ33426.1 hypothetical protein E0H47_27555 [Rhizobium leguminosarum bv. viciae]
MTVTGKAISIFCAVVLSLICASVVCFAMFSIMIQAPVSNPFVWWSLTSYTGVAAVFGSIFLLTFCVLMSRYLFALRRARQD